VKAAVGVCACPMLAIRQKTQTSHDPTKHFFMEIIVIFNFLLDLKTKI
jgi:hypothetical protein